MHRQKQPCFLGHDPSREKVKDWLAIDEHMLIKEEEQRRREFVEHAVKMPKVARQSRQLLNAAPKALRVVQGRAKDVRREKVRERLGVDPLLDASVADQHASDEELDFEKARSPALVTAPEKMKRVLGYDPIAAKLCRQLGLEEHELERVLIEALETQARATAMKEARAASQQRRRLQKALDRLGIDVSEEKRNRLLGFDEEKKAWSTCGQTRPISKNVLMMLTTFVLMMVIHNTIGKGWDPRVLLEWFH